MIDFVHSLKTTQISTYYAAGMSERERRLRRTAPVVWTRHTRICSVHFEGALGRTKLNPVPSIFAFPRQFQRKLPKSRYLTPRRDDESSEGTTRKSKNKKLFTSRKKQCIKPELMDHGSKEESSSFQRYSCRPVYVDA